LFRMYSETVKYVQKRIQVAKEKLTGRCKEILTDYMQKGFDKNTDFKVVVSKYTQIIVQILNGINDLSDSQFLEHLPLFFTALNDLMLTDSQDIRQALRNVFIRIGKIQKITS